MRKTLVVALLAFTMLTQAGCGTLLHPERSGNKGGRIDPAIAILDGIGVLFYVIPGLIAFAVDFSNGTIYLPHSASSANSGKVPSDGYRAVTMDEPVDAGSIERLIEREYSVSGVLHHESLETYPAL
ncbi:MAG: hypothetical protein HKN43_10675 [Rhodothermales bacterium]|nr:hypothetical protein [Rhodothermales bacterium]